MTTPTNENEVQGQDEQVLTEEPGFVEDTDNSSSPTGDDIYAPYLEKFPTSLHPIAREVFREWDGNVTKRLQSVHSEYEPYKQFVENYEPDALQQAITIAEALDTDPKGFYTALAEAYGFSTPEQGQQIAESLQQQEPDDGYDQYDPVQQRLAQQEELLRTMAEAMLAERNAAEQAQQEAYEDQVYEQTMAALEEQYGQFDVDYVNALLAQGYEPEQAIAQWQQSVDQYAQQRLAPIQNAPVVMGAGGGTPSIQRDTANLSSQETKQLVEQMLRQAAESGR